MSMRPPVDRQRILHFLQNLGQRFRKPCRDFLVGGVMLPTDETTTSDANLHSSPVMFVENAGQWDDMRFQVWAGRLERCGWQRMPSGSRC